MVQKNCSGFSLIEILVVATVIGILVTIAVPGYLNALERSKCSKAVNNIKALQSAEQNFFAENEQYSGDVDELSTLVGADFAGMDTRDTDWTYTVNSPTAITFTITARRSSGAFQNDTIMVTQDDAWTWVYPNPL